MELIRVGEQASSIDGGAFTGGVELEMLLETSSPEEPDIAWVRFEADTATYWHSHAGGQALLFLDGTGRIGTEDGQCVVPPGTYVFAPPGERHWHGAGPDAPCAVLSITWGEIVWETEPPPRLDRGRN
jgi:quercetin dioxygenase-like cupin family protein